MIDFFVDCIDIIIGDLHDAREAAAVLWRRYWSWAFGLGQRREQDGQETAA